jgi:hypothetical protein
MTPYLIITPLHIINNPLVSPDPQAPSPPRRAAPRTGPSPLGSEGARRLGGAGLPRGNHGGACGLRLGQRRGAEPLALDLGILQQGWGWGSGLGLGLRAGVGLGFRVGGYRVRGLGLGSGFACSVRYGGNNLQHGDARRRLVARSTRLRGVCLVRVRLRLRLRPRLRLRLRLRLR